VRLRVWYRWSPALADRWARLLPAVSNHTIFQTWEWNHAWWKAFGRGCWPCIVGVERAGGELVALAPWMVTFDARRRLRRIEFVGTPNRASDYADVLVAHGEDAALEPLVRWLVRRTGPHTEIDLRHLREDSPTLASLGALLTSARVRWRQADMEGAPTRLLGDADADRALLEKKSLRRHHRALARAGRLEYRVAQSLDEVLAELPTFFDQHVRRREAAGTRSQFLNPPQREFYAELARRLFPRGWLHFSVVRLDGAPIAYHFGLQYRGSYLWYKPSFEPLLAARSPGEVLLRYLIADVVDRGFAELDFTIGTEPFKDRFANHRRRVLRLVVPRRRA
jgi:CelD/BcsL family acetyltransferase involved in cellulose biosynthesis